MELVPVGGNDAELCEGAAEYEVLEHCGLSYGYLACEPVGVAAFVVDAVGVFDRRDVSHVAGVVVQVVERGFVEVVAAVGFLLYEVGPCHYDIFVVGVELELVAHHVLVAIYYHLPVHHGVGAVQVPHFQLVAERVFVAELAVGKSAHGGVGAFGVVVPVVVGARGGCVVGECEAQRYALLVAALQGLGLHEPVGAGRECRAGEEEYIAFHRRGGVGGVVARSSGTSFGVSVIGYPITLTPDGGQHHWWFHLLSASPHSGLSGW